MCKYIQYYQKVLPYLVECVGSDSIIKPDQRYNSTSLCLGVIKGDYQIPKGAVAFAICQGTNVYNAKPITEPILLINH